MVPFSHIIVRVGLKGTDSADLLPDDASPSQQNPASIMFIISLKFRNFILLIMFIMFIMFIP